MATRAQIQAAQAMMRARAPQASGGQAGEVKYKLVNAEPYVYWDLLLLPAAVTFANMATPTQFFATRTQGSGPAITNMQDVNKLDAHFLCSYISVDVFCDGDAAATAGVATAQAFVESIVNYCSLELRFGTVTKWQSPICKLPSGGGVVVDSKIRTQASAANSDSATANNGVQTAQARRKLGEPILFRRGETFNFLLHIPNGSNSTLARLQALQALTSTFQAGIRVNLEGVRASNLLAGTPSSGYRLVS